MTVDIFFANIAEYQSFLLFRNEQRKRVSDFTCLAMFKKEEDRFLYSVELRDPVTNEAFSASEYIRPFEPNQKNVDIFNEGVAECARRLQTYLATGQIDEGLPAFGILSCDSPDETAPPPPPYNYVPAKTMMTEINQGSACPKYFPAILESRLVKRYKAGQYAVDLLTDVICAGLVQCSHLLVAYDKNLKRAFVIAAEYNNLSLIHKGSGTHFLGQWNGEGHHNLGASDKWGDISEFEKKACELMNAKLETPVVEI